MIEFICFALCAVAAIAAYQYGRLSEFNSSKEKLAALNERLYKEYQDNCEKMKEENKSILDHASQTVSECEIQCGRRLLEQIDIYDLYIYRQRQQACWETHETWIDSARSEKLMVVNNKKYKVICLGEFEEQHAGEEL